jgi:anti-anti-sigma factor
MPTKTALNFTYSLEDRPECGASLIRLKGSVDAFSYMALKTVLKRISDGELGAARRNMLIDFRDVQYCASSGWSVLFLQSALLKERQGRMVLFDVSERASHALSLLVMREPLLQVVEDEAAALECMARAA